MCVFVLNIEEGVTLGAAVDHLVEIEFARAAGEAGELCEIHTFDAIPPSGPTYGKLRTQRLTEMSAGTTPGSMLKAAKNRFGTMIGALTLLFAMSACTPTYPACEKDSHCEEKAQVCVEKTCQQCRDDSQCASTDECKGGRCEPKAECAQDGDCDGQKVCQSGKCKLECSASADCGEGLKCSGQNKCIDKLACMGPMDCGAGSQCSSGRCTNTENVSRSFADSCELTNIEFAFNRAQLSQDSLDKLQAIAECIQAKSGVVTIEGHCDERGTEEYNLSLGEERARSVRKYLIGLGVPRSKLQILSKGELEPVDSGSNDNAWSRNRRAQFIE
jgi:peptidoglycan-associated lipoprotein